MKTHHLTSPDAKELFRTLYGNILAQKYGMALGNIRTAPFYEDLFVITDRGHFDGVPLPFNVEFTHLLTRIANAPSLPRTIVAKELALDKPPETGPFRLDASSIEKITCQELTLVDAGAFPRLIEAGEVIIEESEAGLVAGHPNLNGCTVNLTSRHPSMHKDFLMTLVDIPEDNRLNLTCNVGRHPLHVWGASRRCAQYWSDLDKSERTRISALLAWYKSIDEERNRAKEVLETPATPEPLETMTVGVELA